MHMIMLILTGTVRTAFALNRVLPMSQMARFSRNSAAAAKIVEAKAAGSNVLGKPRPAIMEHVAHHRSGTSTNRSSSTAPWQKFPRQRSATPVTTRIWST
jgi:PiT family inorganic phosphate transporter